MGFFGKSRAQLLLDHHAEVEDLRRIIADQAAEIGAMSGTIAELRAQAAEAVNERSAALDYATRLRIGALGLAESWNGLGHAGNYRMAAAELHGFMEQLGAIEPADRPVLQVVKTDG
ncbi:hypothetical protein FLW53_23320 [Microbispora sp. SCL1-1]|uniref:hypothetical protein n=1 Tax=unclassified Microbispora TaxID=2614687 RepID=UPI00115BA884|nr:MULTISPECIES: hypothetical protein [unclassified Microbispora]NJP27075.1 hypothetical protein [Microbispora sp. CL1-1]TQS11422.1 hypothetical protein FLW53_23320 [Microbispora sp. SCL1-1]